jgi:biotin-(acetyl-CoA carboxylase) ligase
MEILAEIPAVAQLPAAPDGQVIDKGTLSAVERTWWERLSPHERLHRSVSDEVFWEAGAVIDEAAESQFDLLVTAAQQDAPLPDTLACIALTGSGFHGHRRRPWQALRGNLHFTSFCRLPLDAARCGPALSMLPTLAVTDLLRATRTTDQDGSTDSRRCWIKWINDVFLGSGKVAGSLVSTQVNGDRIESFVMGIGLNLAVAPGLDSTGFVGRTTALREVGIELSLAAAFTALRGHLARRITRLRQPGGPEALFRDYHRRSGTIGQRVSIYREDASSPADLPQATGRLMAIHPDLSLELEGCPERFRSGRLLLAPRRSQSK